MVGLRCRQHNRTGDIFRDERGLTTTSMVLSLLITLSLVFTAAQVYRVNSIAADVQDVADAAALAAENQVAEFIIIARFCDAVVLSLSLTGITACGLGIAALCTPMTATLSEGLIKIGEETLKARNSFSDRAVRVLNKLQEALPYLAAACAAGVTSANNTTSSGSSYLGIGLLVPSDAEDIKTPTSEKSDQLTEDIDEKADEIRERAKEAEEAAQEANQAKQRAFEHDCGLNPNYCMYERAAKLIGMSGTDNPLYNSVDTWSFSNALERAKRYYAIRKQTESPESGSASDMARWNLRVMFYKYASALIDRTGYVHEDGENFAANFPTLPKNTAEMRSTSLYTTRSFLITEEDGGEVMHAYSGCPGATGTSVGYGSIAYMEGADLSTCPICDFTASSMGKVAAASTSIANGFEYHYAIVADEARNYQQACERAAGPKSEVRSEAGKLLEEWLDALKEAADQRITVSPPGRFGAVAVVANTGATSSAGGFANGFVSAGTLGTRAAISAATLLEEGSDEDKTVLNSLLDGLKEDGGAAIGAAGIVLDLWSKALTAYSNGIDSITDGIEQGLNSIPLVGASGLGTWAADKLRDTLDTFGLDPIDLASLKPVLVNSAHVAAKSDGSFAQGLVSVKGQVIAHPLYSTDLFSALLSDAQRTVTDRIEGLPDTIEIASIELLGPQGPSIPLSIPLPEQAKQFGISLIDDLIGRLQVIHAETVEVRAWE